MDRVAGGGVGDRALVKVGAAERARSSLEKAGLVVELFDGGEPEPLLQAQSVQVMIRLLLRQLPLLGYSAYQLSGESAQSLTGGVQVALPRGFLATARYNVARVAENDDGFSLGDLHHGFGLSLGTRSFLGPVEITLMAPALDGPFSVRVNLGSTTISLASRATPQAFLPRKPMWRTQAWHDCSASCATSSISRERADKGFSCGDVTRGCSSVSPPLSQWSRGGFAGSTSSGHPSWRFACGVRHDALPQARAAPPGGVGPGLVRRHVVDRGPPHAPSDERVMHGEGRHRVFPSVGSRFGI